MAGSCVRCRAAACVDFLMAMLVVFVALVGSPSSRAGDAYAYRYDGPLVPGAETRDFKVVASGPTQLGDAAEVSTSARFEALGTSTTSSRSFVATEAAGPAGAIERQWAQAPYDGFLGNYRAAESLQPGPIIDRYGGETGRFFSPAGTSFEARALPAGSGPLNTYEVLKPLDVQAGIVAPAFGQPGLGIQYMAPQTVADLIEGGFIKPVTP